MVFYSSATWSVRPTKLPLPSPRVGFSSMPNSYLLQKLMLGLLLISGEQNYPKHWNTQISPSKTAFQDSVIRAVQNPDRTVSDIFTDKFKENRKFLCSQSPACEFFSADLPHCREILYSHHQQLKCSKKGAVGMAGLYKTIPKVALDTRDLQGLLSQCQARSLWHWWSFQLSSLWLGVPSLPAGPFPETPLPWAMPLSHAPEPPQGGPPRIRAVSPRSSPHKCRVLFPAIP